MNCISFGVLVVAVLAMAPSVAQAQQGGRIVGSSDDLGRIDGVAGPAVALTVDTTVAPFGSGELIVVDLCAGSCWRGPSPAGRLNGPEKSRSKSNHSSTSLRSRWSNRRPWVDCSNESARASRRDSVLLFGRGT